MIIFMTVLMIASLIILVLKRRNSYTYLFVSKLALIDIYLMLTVFFVVKKGNFNSILTWEMSIYFLISNIKVNYYTLFDLFVLAVTVYMGLSLIAAMTMYSKERGRPFLYAVLSIPALFFLYINLSMTGMRLHFAVMTESGGIVRFAARNLNNINAAVLVFYFCLPYIVAAAEAMNTKIKYKKNYLIATACSMLAIDFLASAALWIAPYRLLFFYAPDFVRSPGRLSIHINQGNLIFLVAGMVLLAVFAYFATVKKIFDNINLSSASRHSAPKKSMIYFNDTRPVFHTFKNILLSIDLIAKTMEQKNPDPETASDLRELRNVVNESVTQMARLLDIYNDPNEIIESTDLAECIKSGIKKAALPEDVEISIDAPPGGVRVNADELLLEEIFVNLAKNSYEAIQQTDRKGKIDVRILIEGGWSCTVFSDNGCGIAKKDYSNIFRPLYSTKKTRKNWGIGLSYASNVIMSMGGKITVSSKKGKYTEFEVILPRERGIEQKGEKAWKKYV